MSKDLAGFRAVLGALAFLPIAAPCFAQSPSCAALADAGAYPLSARALAPLTVTSPGGWIGAASDLVAPVPLSDRESELLDQVLQRLADRGHRVVLALPPPRALSAESGIAEDRAQTIRQAYERAAQDLARRGVILADVARFADELAKLGMDLYRSDDPALTDDGTIAVAQAVLRSLLAAGVLKAEPEFIEIAAADPPPVGRYGELAASLCAQTVPATSPVTITVTGPQDDTAPLWLAASDKGVGPTAPLATALSAVLATPIKSAGGMAGSVWGLLALVGQRKSGAAPVVIWEASDLFGPTRPLAALRALSATLEENCTDSAFRLTRQTMVGPTDWVDGPLGLALQDRLELSLPAATGPVEVELTYADTVEQLTLFPAETGSFGQKIALDLKGARGQTPHRIRLRLPETTSEKRVTATACPAKPLIDNIQLTSQQEP